MIASKENLSRQAKFSQLMAEIAAIDGRIAYVQSLDCRRIDARNAKESSWLRNVYVNLGLRCLIGYLKCLEFIASVTWMIRRRPIAARNFLTTNIDVLYPENEVDKSVVSLRTKFEDGKVVLGKKYILVKK